MSIVHRFYAVYIKRLLDLFFGVIMIIVLAIPLAIIAICIVITEGRPIIFKQARVGQHGKKFFIYKFRTMVKDAEKLGPKMTKQNDSRITRIGNVLRKTSLDELPQIINVIKGEMSFIGYRPDVYREQNTYQEVKFMLKPGITGYAQVNGRSRLTLEEAQYWEEAYVKDVSFITDLIILMDTFNVVLNRKGSN